MSKRVADKQLTLENFEEEEEREEQDFDSSHSQIASPEVLKTRVVAKAKRRLSSNTPNSCDDSLNNANNDNKKTAFSGFSGFKGFGSNFGSNSISSVNAFETLSKPQTITTPESSQSPQKSELKTTNGSKSLVDNSLVSDKDEIYNKKLSELNQCFISHVKTYQEKSKYYDFTQVCREYIEFHQKIESELNDKNSETTVTNNNKGPNNEIKSITSTPTDSQNSSQIGFGFGSQSAIAFSSSTSSPISSQASDNQLSQPKSSQLETMFAKPSIQFSFGSNKLNTNSNNSFSTGTYVSNNETVGDNEDDTHVPPKVESVSHQEPDSVFEKRCKLYYKKGDSFVEKGLGSLFIKKEENATNAQLLIRADTKLGNVLLNISLVDSLPISKADNNKGVLLTCIPNPPLDPKASSDIQKSVTFLIRVKANDDCEQLFNNLIRYKSA